MSYEVSPENYDEATGETTPAEFEHQTIAFVQETLKDFVTVGVGGVPVKEGNMVGLVAASDLEYTIVNHHTRLEWQNKTWLVVSHETISSGNEKAMIRILAE